MAAGVELPLLTVCRVTACNVSIGRCSSFGVRAQSGGSFVLEVLVLVVVVVVVMAAVVVQIVIIVVVVTLPCCQYH